MSGLDSKPLFVFQCRDKRGIHVNAANRICPHPTPVWDPFHWSQKRLSQICHTAHSKRHKFTRRETTETIDLVGLDLFSIVRFCANLGLIIPWSQVRVLAGPPPFPSVSVTTSIIGELLPTSRTRGSQRDGSSPGGTTTLFLFQCLDPDDQQLRARVSLHL